MSLGQRIKQARSQKGLTQADLAMLSGVKQQMVSKLETGKSIATADIVKLAHALEVSPEWLQGVAEDPGPYTINKTAPARQLDKRAVRYCLDFLTAEFGPLLKSNNLPLLTRLFSTCYAISADPEWQALGKKALFTALKKSTENVQ